MCVRFCPLTIEEAELVLAARYGRANSASLCAEYSFDPTFDAHPGKEVPLYLPTSDGGLAVASLAWGFPLNDKPFGVFNTRLETALQQYSIGSSGMWTEAIANGRCLVPMRAFYESHKSEKIPSLRTGKPISRQYRFSLPGAKAFLVAGVQADGRFSIVTTQPNPSVSPIHNRMPLVLGKGESSIWLSDDFHTLADRNTLALTVKPER